VRAKTNPAKEVLVYEKWKALWARLFGRSHGWTRGDKVLEYVLLRIGEGARLQEVVQEEYVRRMATRHEMVRILTDLRIVGSSREGMRRDLGLERMSPRRTSKVDRPDITPQIERWPRPGTRRRKAGTGASDRSQAA